MSFRNDDESSLVFRPRTRNAFFVFSNTFGSLSFSRFSPFLLLQRIFGIACLSHKKTSRQQRIMGKNKTIGQSRKMKKERQKTKKKKKASIGMTSIMASFLFSPFSFSFCVVCLLLRIDLHRLFSHVSESTLLRLAHHSKDECCFFKEKQLFV